MLQCYSFVDCDSEQDTNTTGCPCFINVNSTGDFNSTSGSDENCPCTLQTTTFCLLTLIVEIDSASKAFSLYVLTITETVFYRHADPVYICIVCIHYIFFFPFRNTSDEFRTGEYWKCSDEEEASWSAPFFNDSHWPNAVVVNPAEADEAPGIWHPDQNASKIYCRAEICDGS